MKYNTYRFYNDKYNLKTLSLKLTDSKIMFLIYDEKYNYYYLDHSITKENAKIDILDKIKELNELYHLKITNFYPVCYCEETLVIAFKTEISTNVVDKINSSEITNKYQSLIAYHKHNYSTLFVSANVKKEISMSQKYINRYRFHEKILKRYIFTKERRRKQEFHDLLYRLLPIGSSIIDVSCGDSSDIFVIAAKKRYKTIVGNDICLNYLNLDRQKNVIYTNDDVELNRIKKGSYDVSFCKNTLHHMNNITNINNMLDFLDTISNTIIIVEIMSPKEYKGLPRFLNKYLYTKFLKDVGSCYLNEEQFTSLINNKFKKNCIEYYTFTNILGTYKIAKIKKKENNHEN